MREIVKYPVCSLVFYVKKASRRLRGEQGVLAPGRSSLVFMMLVIGGIQMVVMGFIGVYVGYVFQETKHRPTYLVKNLHMKHTNLNQSFTRE
jgi:hypothetical protein